MRTLLAAALLLTAPAAHADIFVWKDAHTGMSLTYPDTWDMEHNQAPDTVLTIMGPDIDAQPICRARVNEDRRFVMYPQILEDSLQQVDFSLEYWDKYLRTQYKNVRMTSQYDHAGLGRGHAGYAIFEYDEETRSGDELRKGFGFASHYYDKVFTFECTAVAHHYHKWVPHFLNIVKSVNFKKTYAEHITGDYRDFINKDARQD